MKASFFLGLTVVLALALVALACNQREPREARTAPSITPGVFAPSTVTPAAPDTTPSGLDDVPSPTGKALAPTDRAPSAADKAPAPTDKAPAAKDKVPAPTNQAEVQPVVLLEKVDGYLALAPAQLRSGQVEGISVSLFQGRQATAGRA